MPLRPTHPDGTPIQTASEFAQQAQNIADLYPSLEVTGPGDGPALDLGETAAVQLSLEPVAEATVEPAGAEVAETPQEQFLRELAEDRADRDDLVGWQQTDETAPVRRPDTGGYTPRPTRHIRRTGPIATPRSSKGMSKFVPTYVPPNPGQPSKQEVDRNRRRVRGLLDDRQQAREQAEQQRKDEERDTILKAARDNGLTDE